ISDTEIQYLSARLCTLSDTVKTYNSDTVEAIKKAFGPQYDLHKLEDLLHTIQAQEEPFGILLKQRDKLLEALAFACNQLRPHQQHYMLLLTKAELTEMTKEKRNELINYLYAQPFDEGERKILENELAGKTTNPGFLKNAFYLLTGQPSNDDLIVELFNSLPVIVQSDFREQNEQADTVRLQGQEKARNDIKKVSIKLKIINKNLATYSNRLLGRLFIAEKTGDESDTADARALATLVSNLEGKKAEYESQIEALSLMLPEKEQEEYKSQKGPPLPPEWMDYINAATDIAAKEVAKTFDSALDNYLKSLAGTSHDDKKQVDTGGNFLGEILDCFTMNAESVKKEVTRILDKSKETQDPAEQVLLEHKAYFAQKFLGRLQEQHRIEFEKVKQKYEAGAAKSLKRHGLTPLKPEVTPKEELDQLTQKLKHSREGAFLVADSWYVKKNLRVAVDDFKNQKLLTHTDRQIFVEGMAAKKPAFEKKLKTFEALSLDNKLAVITLFLEQKKGIQVDAYIKLLCESVEASHKRKFYEDYLRTEKSQAYLILCKAYESRRKE
ncbi:MAG: hypothetical protein LLF94_12070, partial [Chlamydiales bacterium]|nr:hypothetical protein [Chlamydiales bacterium]